MAATDPKRTFLKASGPGLSATKSARFHLDLKYSHVIGTRITRMRSWRKEWKRPFLNPRDADPSAACYARLWFRRVPL